MDDGRVRNKSSFQKLGKKRIIKKRKEKRPEANNKHDGNKITEIGKLKRMVKEI